MYKIAVIGEYDSIFGFAALGLDTYPVSDVEEGKRILRTLENELYGVIYITESLAAQLYVDIEKLQKNVLPAIILIPGIDKNTGAGIEQVKDSVKKAVGSDILFGEA